MFTGIVRGLFEVKKLDKKEGLYSFGIEFPSEFCKDLSHGCSIAIDGVCLTVTQIRNGLVFFDAMDETLRKTTLGSIEIGTKVNIERAACFGDEIGGHLLSGHVFGKGVIQNIEIPENNHIITFGVEQSWMKYILPKGYIALDGVSLTIVDTHKSGWFTVFFIPETLQRTTFGYKSTDDYVNIEIDTQTQAIVETVERVLLERGSMI